MDILLENFKRFLYIAMDIEHQKNAFYIQSLLCVCVDSLDSIIADLDIINNDSFSLCNNMRDLILLNNWTNR